MKTPKWRPVFGETYPPGFMPPNEDDEFSSDESEVKATMAWMIDNNRRSSNSPKPKSAAKTNAAPVLKLKPKAWPDYFAKMDPVERILFAYMAYLMPEDESLDRFNNYSYKSFRYLDEDLPGLDYPETSRLLSKWIKIGFLTKGHESNTYTFKDEAARAFRRFINKQVESEMAELEPEKSLRADLPGTLDNLFNFLVLVELGEILVTRSNEIHKNSLKRALAALTGPTGADDSLFNMEIYFFWLLEIVQSFQLIMVKGDRLVLTPLGRDLTGNIKAENFLCDLCQFHIDSITNKGFFLMLPVLSNCTQWTSWSYLVTKLIPNDNSCNLMFLGAAVTLLEPLRYLGLLEWGRFKSDILVRITPLGQLVITKLFQGEKLEDYTAEIKSLTDQIYPMSGPDNAYVQPNFEILLPRSASWNARWELSEFAVLEQQDQMIKYRLDKTYLMNALKRGMPSDHVFAVLKKLSQYPLPENLVLTLQQWIDSFGQVTFLHITLLECASPEQAASIASSRKYREYVLGLYSPNAVIVKDVEKLRKLLEKQGIYPSPGVLHGKDVVSRQVKE